jgi:hypothetical protein
MSFVEEVFKNKGKWYGGHTGTPYEKSEVEDIGGIYWSKGSHQAPGEVILKMEYDKDDGQPEEPHEKNE